jgi:pimeloyl-ACP methyl ester carboxylesterase
LAGRLLSLDVAGSGEPLVLLHGLATNRQIWSGVVPTLARHHRVVTADLPGFGASAPAGEGFELGEVADRIARGLAAQGITGPLDLVGHSLGAGVALTLASRRPRLVRRLVLVSPAGLRALPEAASAVLAASADAMLWARRSLVGLTDLAWGRRLLLAVTAADGAAIAPSRAREMVNASATARRTAPALAAIAVADLRPLLAEVPAGVGVIWGEADLTMPARLAGIVAEVRPDAEVVLVPDTAHVPMVERPGEFAGALERVLARLAGRDRAAEASQRGNNSVRGRV